MRLRGEITMISNNVYLRFHTFNDEENLKESEKSIKNQVLHTAYCMENLMSYEKVRETNEPWCIKIDEMIYDKKKNFDDIKDYLHTWGQKNILITLF